MGHLPGAVNLFEGKKGGRSTSYLAPHKGSYLYDVFVFTLFYEIHDTYHMKCFMEKLESLLYKNLH